MVGERQAFVLLRTGIERILLTLDSLRRAVDDAEQQQVQEQQPSQRQQVQPARVGRDAGGDRPVRQVQLERACRLLLVEAQREVYLQQLAEPALVDVLRLVQGADVG